MAKESKTRSIDEILAKASDPAYVRVATARIPLVPDELRERHRELDAQLKKAVEDDRQSNSIKDSARSLAEQVEAVQAEMEAATVEFRFRSIGFRAWSDLKRAHPPTKDQLKRNARAEFDEDRFPVAAIAASCVDPEMTEEQVEALLQSPLIDEDGFNRLLGACGECNVGGGGLPKSMLAGVILRRNGQSDVPPITSGSLVASSSAES